MTSILEHPEVAEVAPNPKGRYLGLVAKLLALKSGFALATLIAVVAGSRWGWVLPVGDVHPGFLGSGLITVAAFAACAVQVPRASKAFYLFAMVLNVTSIAVAVLRGTIGVVGLVAVGLSVVMLVMMVVPAVWRELLGGIGTPSTLWSYPATFLLGAALLLPLFMLGGADGADRDGFIQRPTPGVDTGQDFADFIAGTGANEACLMGRMYFEFGAATLSSWDETGPTDAQIATINELASTC